MLIIVSLVYTTCSFIFDFNSTFSFLYFVNSGRWKGDMLLFYGIFQTRKLRVKLKWKLNFEVRPTRFSTQQLLFAHTQVPHHLDISDLWRDLVSFMEPEVLLAIFTHVVLSVLVILSGVNLSSPPCRWKLDGTAAGKYLLSISSGYAGFLFTDSISG